MKTLATLALVGTVAAAALMPSIASADGRRWDDRWDRHHHHYNGGWNGGDAFIAGTALGLTFGALGGPVYAAPPPAYGYYDYPPPPPRAYRATEAHIDWCSARYASYSAEDNTYVDYYGRLHECVGPY